VDLRELGEQLKARKAELTTGRDKTKPTKRGVIAKLLRSRAQ
jgi:hypothetical protein